MDDHKQTLIVFGSRLREIRRSQGLSQEGLANKADIDRSYLGGIERGEHNLALINIIRLSKALAVHPSELFKGF